MTQSDKVLLLLIMMSWGLSVPLAKILLEVWPPFMALGFRTFLMVLCFLPFIKTWPDLKVWKSLGLFVILQYFLHQGLNWTAMPHLDASTFTLLQQSSVFFGMVIGIWFLKEQFVWQILLGALIGLLGLMVIFGAPDIRGKELFGFMVIAASLFAVLSSLQLKKIGKVDPWHFIFVPSVLAVPGYAAASFSLETNQWQAFLNTDWQKFSVILAFQVVVLNIVFIQWQKILLRVPFSQVSTMTLLIPIFAILASIVILDEQLTLHIMIGAGLVLSGAALILLHQHKTPPADPEPT
jgi:drug/metabolite transporter (DMT)-like permease